MAKSHKGKIEHWFKMPCLGGLGWRACGMSIGHPEFDGSNIRTSYVLNHDQQTGEIETRNSRYTLIGEEALP